MAVVTASADVGSGDDGSDRRAGRTTQARRVLGVGLVAVGFGVVALLLPNLLADRPGVDVPADDAAVGCPVTVPEVGFVPPGPWPRSPEHRDSAWYGTPRLWTVLPHDGGYQPRKSVWWSADFGGGSLEPEPDITVVWERLDAPDLPPITSTRGTNAHTAADGWYMIAGHDPDRPGCWRATASYRGTELSYVYEVPGIRP